MIARLAAPLAAGAFLGVIWLTFLGVPFIVPSYLSLAIEHRRAEAAAGAQQERGDTIEELRGEEAQDAQTATQDERLSCDARLSAQERLWRARCPAEPQGDQNHEEGPVCGDFRPLRDSLRDAGLVDG